jgi:hypothetical protein
VDEIEASKMFVLFVKRCVGVDLANEELGGIYPLNCLIGIDLYVRKIALQSSHMPNEKKLKSLSHLL